MSSKGLTELQISVSRAKNVKEAAGDIRFCVFPQKTSENAEKQNLLKSNLRAGTSDLNELIIALKFRFLHLLAPEDQRAQASQLIDMCDTELARLDDLLLHHDPEGGHFTEWLKHDIQRLEERLNWLTVFRDKL